MKTLIKNINIIDPKKEEIDINSSIAVDNGQIKDIGKNISQNKSNYENIIDGEDNYILSGFIDSHVHLMARGFVNSDYMSDPLSYYFYKGAENCRKTLECGVTTARDCGLLDYGVKLSANKRLIYSPKLQISIMPMSITGGHFDITLKSGYDMIPQYSGFPHPVANGVEGVIGKTREIVRSGADFVKVMASGGVISESDSPQDIQYNKKELKAIVDEANRLGKRKVATHCHGLGGLELSLKVGVHSIEHGTSVTKNLAQKMVKKGTFLIPTFSVIQWQRKQAKNKTLPEDKIPKALEVSKIHKENIEIAYNEGVKIAMGTDSGVHEHGQNLKELEHLVNMGMDEREALIAGTLTSAECLGLEDKIGSIETGKSADFIITNKNPLENIKSLQNKNNLKIIIQDGNTIKNILN